jgi:hypothetical protein
MKRLIIFLGVLCFACSKNKDEGMKNSCIDDTKINQNVVCIEIYEPVCGCDGITYSNSCYADNSGVKLYEIGTCD